jgi:uncharacterized integral membrane protein (TIGR00698 family)
MSTLRAGTYSPFEPMTDDALLSLGSMEGLAELPSTRRKSERLWPGYAAAAGISLIAYAIHYLPFFPFLVGARRPISASIIAIVVAVLIRNLLTVPAAALPGCKSVIRKMIPAAIVLTGAGLNLTQVAGVGWKALLITVAGMGLATIAALALGSRFGLLRKTSLLIGAGTAVCGTSAIVAAAPLIEADDEDVTLSVGTVNLLGLILMFALPVAGGLLGLDQTRFGVWAGTSIHAVPQVVAAGFTYGSQAGTLATLVKLARVTLLVPFLLVLLMLSGKGRRTQLRYGRLIPAFLWGFLILAGLNTASLLPSLQFHPAAWLSPPASLALGPSLVELGNWLLTLAMAAIGLEVNLRLLMRVGTRALAAGAGAAIALCAATWAMIRLFL